MNILITGATGLIGSALQSFFSTNHHQVYTMVRAKSDNFSELEQQQPFCWQPELSKIKWDTSIELDVIIHLCGAGIADKRWTAKRKQLILNSRVQTTKLLSNYLAQLTTPPKVFISGSAIGFYGDTGNNIVDETSPPQNEFMSHICQQWEAASQTIANTNIRLVNIRTGVVLSNKGGALPQMMLPIKLGVGGRVGSGQQFISWISLQDICQAIDFIISTPSINGPINLVAPTAVTNLEFTKTLGRLLRKPTIMPLPAWLAKLAFGELAEALLLASNRVQPTKLLQVGYQFQHNQLEAALKDILTEDY